MTEVLSIRNRGVCCVVRTACSFLLLLALVAGKAAASVSFPSPVNGATVTGTITIQVTVQNDWWSQLRIDGSPVASGPSGVVYYTWNSTTVKNGTHTVAVFGFPSGKPADSSKP